jgi:hypothetical protein
MKPAPFALSALLLAVLWTGAPQSSHAADAVPVYDSTEIALDRYTVVKRLGVEDWRSAFRIPSYGDEESARRALLVEAARVRADGVINLHCLSKTDRIFNPSGYYCYGNAIKLKNERSVVVR